MSRDDPSETLDPTAPVNEAYLKLADSLRIEPVSRLHFKRRATRAMRRVLVDAARRPSAIKRCGGQALVTFDEALSAAAQRSDDVLALDSALEEPNSAALPPP